MKLNPLILLFVVVLGVYLGLHTKNQEQPTTDSETAPTVTNVAKENKEVKNTQNNDQGLKYEILYTSKQRYDGGTSYYVLLDPVDLNKTDFVDNVKFLIKKFVQEKGKKISIEFYDNKNVLELSYKEYGNLSLGRALNDNENQMKAIHYLAAYSGELNTGLYLNTLYFFPAADSKNPRVGQFVEIKEYNLE